MQQSDMNLPQQSCRRATDTIYGKGKTRQALEFGQPVRTNNSIRNIPVIGSIQLHLFKREHQTQSEATNGNVSLRCLQSSPVEYSNNDNYLRICPAWLRVLPHQLTGRGNHKLSERQKSRHSGWGGGTVGNMSVKVYFIFVFYFPVRILS